MPRRSLIVAVMLVLVCAPAAAREQAALLASVAESPGELPSEPAGAATLPPAIGATPGAEGAAPPLDLKKSDGRPPELFAELWSARRAALARGDTAAAAAKLAELLAAKEAAGWSDAFLYAAALSVDAEAAADNGDSAQALRLAEAAVALAPHAPSAHVALAGARWAAGHLFGMLGAVAGALAAALSEPPLLRQSLGNAGLALMMGLLVTAVVFAMLTLYRYARVMLHDLRHLLPRGASGFQSRLIGITAMLSPLLFRFGVAWAVLVWALILGMYYRKPERIGAVILLVALAGIALVLPAFTAHLAYSGSRAQDLYLATRSLDATDAAARLAARPSPTADELHALGLRAYWSGDLVVARRWLEDSAKAGSTRPELHTALGNVRFQLGDREGAIAAYERAVSLDTEHTLAHFNMSRVYYTLAEHQKAGAAHRRASAIEFDRVEHFAAEAKRVGRGYIVPPEVPRGLLAAEVQTDATHDRAIRQVWRWLGAAAPRVSFAIMALGAALVLGIMAPMRKVLRLAAECQRCGMAACRKCNPEMTSLDQCGQCFHAFVIAKGVDQQLIIRKEIEAHRYGLATSRLRRLASLLLAGGGQLFTGAILRGLLYLTLFCSSIVALLGSLGLLPAIVTLPEPGVPGAAVIVSLGVATVAYLVALWDGAREG